MSVAKKRILAVLISAIVIVLIMSQAIAGAGSDMRVYSAGEWSSDIVSRLNISVSPSDIVVVRPDDAEPKPGEVFTVRITFKIRKTESDFYGKINGITYSGAPYEYITWQRPDTSIPMTPHGCVLESDVDTPKTYIWNADFAFSAELSGTHTFYIKLNTLSGKSAESAKNTTFTIPVNLSFVSGLSLEEAIAAGVTVQYRELYSDETLAALDAAIDNAYAILDEYAVTPEAEISAAIDDIYSAIDALTYKLADYSRIEELKLTIPELSMYSDLSVLALNTVLDAIDYTLDVTRQDEVDAYGYALETAIDSLYPKEFVLIAAEGIAVDEEAATITVTEAQSANLSGLLTASFGTVRITDTGVDIVYNGTKVKSYSVIVIE